MTVYTIVVKGELSPRLGSAFEGMSMRVGGGETALVGDIIDQAHLQGVLSKVADFGLELLRVTPEDVDAPAALDPSTHR